MGVGVGRELVAVAAGAPTPGNNEDEKPQAVDIETGKAGDAETLSQAHSSPTLQRSDTRESFNQQIGVTKIETLYMVFGRGWKLVLLWASIALIAYVWSLAAITTSICE